MKNMKTIKSFGNTGQIWPRSKLLLKHFHCKEVFWSRYEKSLKDDESVPP